MLAKKSYSILQITYEVRFTLHVRKTDYNIAQNLKQTEFVFKQIVNRGKKYTRVFRYQLN